MRAWWLRPWSAYRQLRSVAAGQQKIIDGQSATISGLRTQLAALERELLRERSRLAAAVTDARVSAAVQSSVQPEFVLTGIPRPDGSKRLMASRQLDVTAFAMTEPDQPPPRWKLGVIMGQLLVIDKPDYQQALAHLMTIWGNQDSDARAQVTGKRALPGGDVQLRPRRGLISPDPPP